MRWLIVLMVFTVTVSPHAQDWGVLATVSSSLGVQGSRLCVGESSRGDIGCPAYAPALSAAGHVSVTGNLQAAKFMGDGSGLTNLSLPSSDTDRISTTGVASGANLGMVVADRGTISFTLAGTQGAAYLHATSGLVAPAVSTTTGNVQALRMLASVSGDAATTPSFAWIGDENTGLFRPEADVLGFATGGAERARITSTSLISSVPFVSNSPSGFRIAQTNYGVFMRNDDANFYLLLTDSGSPMGVWNALRPFTINLSTGNVGINNTNPSEKLQVNGTVKATAFQGDGSGLTNLSLPSSATDRISTSGVASGVNLGMVVADRGTISFTLAGTQGAAYLHATAGLVAPAVSTTTGNLQALRILTSTAGEAVGAHGFSWSGDTNTGMYWAGADQLGLTTGGVQRALLNASGLTVTGYVSTTGVIDAGAAIYGFAGDSVTAPGYTWSGDTNTGVYWVGADQLGITAGGVQRVLVNTTGVTVTGNLTATGALSGNTVAGGMVATQAEAEAGTNNDHIMTPLRVLQAITKALSTAPTVPSGAIMAFDLTSCPSGWSEYTPARGRFLRGVDNGAGNDPDGTRTIGATQADMLRSHTHTAYASVNDRNDAATQGWPVDNVHNSFRTSDRTRDVAVNSLAIGLNGGAETRPKNVAVLYCRKS